ncbi:hypothetical protein FDI14_gp124 [Mycobacterium phage SirDuracell]|uniref:RDF protein n=3 Tax=Caudoviricetes TaxID=2731619 RepID=G1D5Z3_9CAUD|nr:hypothetical protein FDG56_gp126 [Mycobacterium phage Bask21]YP_009608058.1 hypothetical protein FDI14_gp124 [Mycobacterium phage SirDuracell]AYQ99803.1 hypothetical protein PBI_MANDA_126 [Mycobacterium phage Manda]AYR00237.1 hypothetical protein PBI_PAT3_125 [Mycobacterium phage Pat3]AEK08424.1 hypothetical protein PBI_BASK21_130 [Mycobacterium phage Bask21]AEK10191.1 hypothetical protein PBI_SIRDURACELL_130 [Mycobacterium phage SirDuracell]
MDRVDELATELIEDYLREEQDAIVPSYDAENIVQELRKHGLLK